MCDLKRKERVCNTNLSSSLNAKALFVSCCMTTGGNPVGQRLATSVSSLWARSGNTSAKRRTESFRAEMRKREAIEFRNSPNGRADPLGVGAS
jgi:hypothetical protein